MEHNPGGVEKQKYVDIDGLQYKFHVMMPSKAFELSARLTKYVLEPAGFLMEAGGDEAKVAATLPAAMKSLKMNFHEKEVWSIIVEMMKYASYDGKSFDVDVHFMGRLGHMMKVVYAMMEYQFKDFLDAIRQGVAGLMNQMQSQ